MPSFTVLLNRTPFAPHQLFSACRRTGAFFSVRTGAGIHTHTDTQIQKRGYAQAQGIHTRLLSARPSCHVPPPKSESPPLAVHAADSVLLFHPSFCRCWCCLNSCTGSCPCLRLFLSRLCSGSQFRVIFSALFLADNDNAKGRTDFIPPPFSFLRVFLVWISVHSSHAHVHLSSVLFSIVRSPGVQVVLVSLPSLPPSRSPNSCTFFFINLSFFLLSVAACSCFSSPPHRLPRHSRRDADDCYLRWKRAARAGVWFNVLVGRRLVNRL